jgi:hypothetical protein
MLVECVNGCFIAHLIGAADSTVLQVSVALIREEVDVEDQVGHVIVLQHSVDVDVHRRARVSGRHDGAHGSRHADGLEEAPAQRGLGGEVLEGIHEPLLAPGHGCLHRGLHLGVVGGVVGVRQGGDDCEGVHERRRSALLQVGPAHDLGAGSHHGPGGGEHGLVGGLPQHEGGRFRLVELEHGGQ